MEKRKVGIDLGTSHVSLVSGDKEVWIPNVAGRASDFIARKLFGEDWLVGERALEEEAALEIYKLMQGGLLNLKDKGKDTVILAQRAVIKEGLQRLELEGEIEAVVGMSPLAIRNQKEDLLRVFEGIVERVMLAPSTFLAGMAEGSLNKTLVVDIGAGTVDLTPLYGAIPSPDDHVVIRVGGDFLDQKLFELFQNEYPDLPCSFSMIRKWKEEYATLEDTSVQVEVPTLEGFRKVEIGHLLRRACKELVPILVKGVKEVLQQLSPERWPVYLQNILLTGRTAAIRGLPETLAKNLEVLGEVRIKIVSRPDMAVAIGAYKLAEEIL